MVGFGKLLDDLDAKEGIDGVDEEAMGDFGWDLGSGYHVKLRGTIGMGGTSYLVLVSAASYYIG
jgi:hypothetical protein